MAIWLTLSAGVLLATTWLLTLPSGDVVQSPAAAPPALASKPHPGVGAGLLAPQNTAPEPVAVGKVALPLPALTARPALSAADQPPVLSTPLPAAGAILDVARNRQERNLNCEFRSATDLAAFYGWDFTWEELFAVVGHDPGGDPNVGFVGRSIDDPVGGIYPAGYGVHVDPVARGLRRLGIAASAHHGVDDVWLRAQIDAGRPVIVWATYGMLPQKVVHWNTQDGDRVAGVPFEHTFTVVGYDDSGVWVNDPWDASQQRYRWSELERSWSLLGHMALTIDERSRKDVLDAG